MHTFSRGSHFVPFWWSKNSTTSGQFSRKCFSFPFCLQLEMLRDRLTAEAGGLGRRLFDQSRVSSEIFHSLSLSPIFLPVSPLLLSLSLVTLPPPTLLSIPVLPFSFFYSSHVPCKLLALWPCLLAPQGSQTEGGSVTQWRQMGALRVASQESKHWWEGSRG